MNQPNIYIDTPSRALRAAEVPDASFVNGMNEGGSNAPAIGVATDVPDLTGDPSGWTLLDQDGAARTPQVSQQIGGEAYAEPADYPLSGGLEGKGINPVLIVNNAVEGDGTSVLVGNATLASLANGWEAL